MNRNKLIIIIALMFVSTLGIGLMQFLWVYNAMHINEKQFEQNVYAALKNIILKLDKQSYAVKINGESIDINDKFNSTIHNSDTNRQITIIPLNGLDSSIQNELSGFQNTIDIIENNKVDLQKTINNLEEVQNQIKVEIQHNDNPLERISLQSIDSIIYKELLSTGILTEYEFAVVKSKGLQNTGISTNYGLAIVNRKEDIIFKSNGFSDVNINSRYRANLFPTDIKEKDFYLIIDVPLKSKYGFNKSFYRILIFSIIVTQIIIVIFFLTAKTIFRQKKLAEIRTDFINNITHELKTPIATLNVAIKTLKQETNISANNTIEIIEKQSIKLQDITNRVIDSSFNNIPNLNKAEVNAKDYLGKSLKEYETSINTEEIKWQYDFSINPVLNISIDQSYFMAALNNILDNSVKYNDKEEKKISISVFDQDRFACIDIQDNGIGISKTDSKRVFEKFYRGLKGNLHNVKGLGIGLYFSKQIIELHDGTINFESKENMGTKFSVKIPVYE